MPEWTVETSGRLDIFLANNEATISRVKARDVIKDGLVMVNGRISRKPAMIVEPGDLVLMSDTGEPVTETRLEAKNLDLEVLYEDDACFVINKPAGIPVHPGAGIPKDAPTVLHGIAHLFRERSLPFSSASVLVHRLDKDTTGCLLIAKTPAHHKALQQQFESRTVHKMYIALVAGVPDPAAAVIDASIGRSTSNRTKMTIHGSSRTREARTTYRTIDATSDVALLSCELHTGRTHQIRVHLHGVGHSILGDPSYHSKNSISLSEKFHISQICLHAWKIAFTSPGDEKKHEVIAPLSGPFATALQNIMPKVSS